MTEDWSAPDPADEPDADAALDGATDDDTPGSVLAGRLIAGAVAGMVAVILVCAMTLGLALLIHAAHTRNGCTGQYDITSRACTVVAGENGFLADWNAVLWSSHGVGVSTGVDITPQGGTGVRDAGVVTARVPLGLGMLLVLGLAVLAGRVGALFGRVRSRADLLAAAGAAALTYYAVMVVVGAVATARGAPGQAVGPDWAQMPFLLLPIAGVGTLAGLLRESRGPGAVTGALARLRDRAGLAGGAGEGALAGAVLGLGVAALLAAVGMLVHRQDTADSAAATVQVITSHPFPVTVLGTVATVVLLGLALPTLAVWMLAFGLVVPKVDLLVGNAAGGIDEHDLLRGPHDGWLWLAVAAPLLAALLCGYVSARRRRAGTPSQALLAGAAGGAGLFLLVAGLAMLVGASDAETLARIAPGVAPSTTEVVDPLGAIVQLTAAAALTLIAGAALGGRLALALVDRPLGLPVLRRWDTAVVGRPDSRPGLIPDHDWGGLPDLAPQLRFEALPSSGDGVDAPAGSTSRLEAAVRAGRRDEETWVAEVAGEADQLDYLRAALSPAATLTDCGIADGPARPWRRPPRRAVIRLGSGAPDLATLVVGGAGGSHSLLLVQVAEDSLEATVAALSTRDAAGALSVASVAVLHPGGDPNVMVGAPAPA